MWTSWANTVSLQLRMYLVKLSLDVESANPPHAALARIFTGYEHHRNCVETAIEKTPYTLRRKATQMSQRMDCRIGVIEFYVSANNRKVTINIDHVSCIWVYMPFVSGTELMINTGSLSNQALKSAHPSLLSSYWWPWGGVFIGAGQLLQHG